MRSEDAPLHRHAECFSYLYQGLQCHQKRRCAARFHHQLMRVHKQAAFAEQVAVARRVSHAVQNCAPRGGQNRVPLRPRDVPQPAN